MRLLLRHGADVNAKMFATGFDFLQLDPGSTPLHGAARVRNLEAAMLMVKYYADNLVGQEEGDGGSAQPAIAAGG